MNLKKLYNLYNEVINSITDFQDLPWPDITPEKITEKEEASKRYKEACQNLPKDLKEWQAYKELKNSIENLIALLPIITLLKKDSIKSRHWDTLNEKVPKRIPYDSEQPFLLSDLIEANVLEFVDDVEEIAESADKQKKIRITMD